MSEGSIHLTRRRLFSSMVFSVALVAAVGAEPVYYGLDTLLHWDQLPRVKPDILTDQASSYDRSGGNADYNHYDQPPGIQWPDVDPVVIRDMSGPGVITRMWMPRATALAAFKLRVFFDNEPAPRIDTFTHNFYWGNVAGHPAISAPFTAEGCGGVSNYYPLAFQQRLRIESQNKSGISHYYQMTYHLLPPNTPVQTYTGTLTPEQQAERDQAAAIIQNVGDNPGPAGSQVIHQSQASIPNDQSFTLADVSGSGVVRRLQIKLDSPDDVQLTQTRLRVYYDGEADPSIDVPLGEFFGAGQGRMPYRALPLGTEHADGYYCYWPMPFWEGIKVQISNQSGQTVVLVESAVEYEPGPLSYDSAYLRAAYTTQHYDAGESGRFRVLDVAGMGHYLGCFLTIDSEASGFTFLEGDDILTVDGQARPTLYGTGTEDAFNGGYYYDTGLYDGPFSGAVRRDHDNGIASQYRLRIPDYVVFNESILVEYEAGYGNWAARDYAAVAYWYQYVPPPLPVRPEPGTLIFQDGRKYPNETAYAGTRDAHILQERSLYNTGGNSVLEATRYDGSDVTHDRSIVVKFADLDTSSEAGKMLQQAILALDYFNSRNDSGSAAKTLHVHKLLHDWGEGAKTGIDGEWAGPNEVCWTKPFGATGGDNPNWNGTLDAQYADPIALDSVTLSSGEYGPVSFDVTQAAREHLADPTQNFGFVIREAEGGESTQDGTRQFHSHEATNLLSRPSLTLTFVDQPSPVNIDAVASMADHGVAGEIALHVNLAAETLPADSALVTTESREAGITKLVIDCDAGVVLPDPPEGLVESIVGLSHGDVTANVVSVTAMADVITVSLNPLADQDTYAVTLASAVIAGDNDFLIRALEGEVDNGGASWQVVNAIDLSDVRMHFGADVTVGDNAKCDIVSDGTIDALDLSTCRLRFTNTAP